MKRPNFFLIAFMLMSSFNSHGSEFLTIGRFKSRAIFNKSQSSVCPAPLIIMIPGSGAHGPEEMMPASVTGNSKDHSIFASFASSFNKNNIGTLALGKPGVEFFKAWDKDQFFYDRNLYVNLAWRDLLDNLGDAITHAKTLECVDPKKIYILGHSEGTMVASDYAAMNPNNIQGLILIGFSGESLATTVDWQLFKRPIDSFIEPEMDKNHDGYISKDEALLFPLEFAWDYKPGEDRVSLVEIENALRSSPPLLNQYKIFSEAKIWNGVFLREPLYEQISTLPQPIKIFTYTGSLDVQTRPEEALRLKEACLRNHKEHCEVEIIDGLGHAMSKPRSPRAQKLLDSTLGPVDETFLLKLEETSQKINRSLP